MGGKYYIFTTSVFNTLDKNHIYSLVYDKNHENVALLSTQLLSGSTEEFDTYDEIGVYLTNNGDWYEEDAELRFEDEYIPSIDD